jgi:tetratricopeptide (TPR) repeat protein
MIKVDIITFYDRLKDKWETKGVLFLLVVILIVSYFLILEHFKVFQIFNNNWLLYLLLPLIISIITILIWLYSTNRFFFKTSKKITAGVILIIDSEKDKLIVAKIVRKVVHHVNNSKAFSNIDIKILPANIYTTEKEVEKYQQNFGFMYDLIIRLFIEAGNFNSIEKIVIEKFSVTFKPKDSQKQKRIFFNIVDLTEDMQLQFGSRDWNYLLSNSGIDNKKYFENIYPIFLYYVGFYAIYVDRFEDALEVMTPIYNSKNTTIPISKKDGNQIKVILKPFNIAEGRLASILVDLFFCVAIKAYQKSETSKAFAYFEKLEQIIKTHPNKFHQYIDMARFSYELDNLDNAIKYTEFAQNLSPNSIEIFLNHGFFAILKDDKQNFCNNYYKIFKNRMKSTVNWIEILAFQLKQQEKLTGRDKYFRFSTSFIEYIFIDQDYKDDFKLVVESYKGDCNYNCIYELGRKILIEEIKSNNIARKSELASGRKKKRR